MAYRVDARELVGAMMGLKPIRERKMGVTWQKTFLKEVKPPINGPTTDAILIHGPDQTGIHVSLRDGGPST